MFFDAQLLWPVEVWGYRSSWRSWPSHKARVSKSWRQGIHWNVVVTRRILWLHPSDAASNLCLHGMLGMHRSTTASSRRRGISPVPPTSTWAWRLCGLSPACQKSPSLAQDPPVLAALAGPPHHLLQSQLRVWLVGIRGRCILKQDGSEAARPGDSRILYKHLCEFSARGVASASWM